MPAISPVEGAALDISAAIDGADGSTIAPRAMTILVAMPSLAPSRKAVLVRRLRNLRLWLGGSFTRGPHDSRVGPATSPRVRNTTKCYRRRQKAEKNKRLKRE